MISAAKLTAIQECAESLARLYGHFTFIPNTCKTKEQLAQLRSRADEANAYVALTGDRIGAKQYVETGMTWSQVFSGVIERQRGGVR